MRSAVSATLGLSLLLGVCLADWRFSPLAGADIWRQPPVHDFYNNYGENAVNAVASHSSRSVPSAVAGTISSAECYSTSQCGGDYWCTRECSFVLANLETGGRIATSDDDGYLPLTWDEPVPSGAVPSSGQAQFYSGKDMWAARVRDEEDASLSNGVMLVGEGSVGPDYNIDASSTTHRWILWQFLSNTHPIASAEGTVWAQDRIAKVIDLPMADPTDGFTRRKSGPIVTSPFVYEEDEVTGNSVGSVPDDFTFFVAGADSTDQDRATFYWGAPKVESAGATTTFMTGGDMTLTNETASPFAIVREQGENPREALLWVLCGESNGLSVKHFSADASGVVTYHWSEWIEGPDVIGDPCDSNQDWYGGWPEDCDEGETVPWHFVSGAVAEVDDFMIAHMNTRTHTWVVVLEKTTEQLDVTTPMQGNWPWMEQRNYYGSYDDFAQGGLTTAVAHEETDRIYSSVATWVKASGSEGAVSWSVIIDADENTVELEERHCASFACSAMAYHATSFWTDVFGAAATAPGGERLFAVTPEVEGETIFAASEGALVWDERANWVSMEFEDRSWRGGVFAMFLFAYVVAQLAVAGLICMMCSCCSRQGQKLTNHRFNLGYRSQMSWCHPLGVFMCCCTNPYDGADVAMAQHGHPPPAATMGIVVTPAADNGYVPPSASRGEKEGRRLSSRSNNSRNSRNSRRSGNSRNSRRSGGSGGKKRRSKSPRPASSGTSGSGSTLPPAYSDLPEKLPY